MSYKDCFFIVCILVLILIGLISIPINHASDSTCADGDMVHLLSFYEDSYSNELYGKDFLDLKRNGMDGQGYLQQLVVELRIANYFNMLENRSVGGENGF